MSLHYNRKLVRLNKVMRHNATHEENKLWYDFLCKHECRFQRQKVIDNYIADFDCHKLKLIIKVDGNSTKH